MNIKDLLGREVIEWLLHAAEQGQDCNIPAWRSKEQMPRDGFWRDTGWARGVAVVLEAFRKPPVWISEPLPGGIGQRVNLRWDAEPYVFLCELMADMIRARQEMATEAGECHFHGATGALDCCITSLRRIRQQVCQHQWSAPYTVGGYYEPPQEVQKCIYCDAERLYEPEEEMEIPL